MEKNPNKMKWCEKGRHSVPVLFHSKKPGRESCCKFCYRPTASTQSLIERAGVAIEEMELAKNKIRGIIANTPPKKSIVESCVGIIQDMDLAVLKAQKRPAKRKQQNLPELLKLAEIVFNKWIRNRDSTTDNIYFVCISCDKMKPIEDADCGHYISKTYSQLRFNEFNCSAECSFCNRQDPNHLIDYRKNLINKIGIERVRELELIPFARTHKWEREELLEIISKYKI